jgi:hypothetical protein
MRIPPPSAQECAVAGVTNGGRSLTGAKEKELVGDFKNDGRECRLQGDPEEVRVHDFLIKTLGQAVPYGIYHLAAMLAG